MSYRFDWASWHASNWGRKRRKPYKAKPSPKPIRQKWMAEVFIPETTIDGRRVWEPMHRTFNLKVGWQARRFVESMALECVHYSDKQ